MTKHISLCIIIVYIDIYTCLYTYMYIIIDVNHVSCYYTTLHSHALYNYMKLSYIVWLSLPHHCMWHVGWGCTAGVEGACSGRCWHSFTHCMGLCTGGLNCSCAQYVWTVVLVRKQTNLSVWTWFSGRTWSICSSICCILAVCSSAHVHHAYVLLRLTPQCCAFA